MLLTLVKNWPSDPKYDILYTDYALIKHVTLSTGSPSSLGIARRRAVGKTIKYTDLTGEDPGPRATIKLGGKLPLVGGKLIMKAKMTPGSPLNRLVTTVALVSLGCACTITLFLIGVPKWPAAGALLLPTVVYLELAVAAHRQVNGDLALEIHDPLSWPWRPTAPTRSRPPVGPRFGRNWPEPRPVIVRRYRAPPH